MRAKFGFLPLLLLALTLFGSLGFKMAEDVSLLVALYFSVITITTVGYGNISQATGAGKA